MVVYISGDMLRAAIAANSPLGQQVKGVMAAGQVCLYCKHTIDSLWFKMLSYARLLR